MRLQLFIYNNIDLCIVIFIYCSRLLRQCYFFTCKSYNFNQILNTSYSTYVPHIGVGGWLEYVLLSYGTWTTFHSFRVPGIFFPLLIAGIFFLSQGTGIIFDSLKVPGVFWTPLMNQEYLKLYSCTWSIFYFVNVPGVNIFTSLKVPGT